MYQIEIDFENNNNSGLQTKCSECLYDNECKDAQKQENEAKNEKDCKRYKHNDLPF